MVSAGSIIRGSFGFVRERPGVVAVWSVVYMVGSLVMSIVMEPLYSAQIDAAAGRPLPPNFFASFATIYVVVIAMFLVLFAAAYRAVLLPEQDRAAYLRFGMDELRLLAMGLFLIIIGIIGMVIVGLVAIALVAAIGAIMGPQAGFIAGLLTYVACLCLYIWCWVRISSAGALTILHQRIVIRDAWGLTRGHFWSLFGGYFVIFLTIFVAFILFFAATLSSYFVDMWQAAGNPVATARIAEAQMLSNGPGSPFWFVMLIVGGILGGIAIALQGAMMAVATRDLLAATEHS